MSNKNLFINELFSKHPDLAASILETQSSKVLADLFSSFSDEEIPLILNKLLPRNAALIVQELGSNLAIKYLEKLNADEISLILRYLDSDNIEEILEALSTKKTKACKLLLNYPLQTVGAWMQTNVITIREDSTIEDEIELIKNSEEDPISDIVCVLDENNYFVGLTFIASILKAEKSKPVKDIITSISTTIPGNTPLSVVEMNKLWESNDFLPVVDKKRKFMGILRHQDLIKASSTFKREDDTEIIHGEPAQDFMEAYATSMVELFNLGSKMIFKSKI